MASDTLYMLNLCCKERALVSLFNSSLVLVLIMGARS
jgi:hypothetical protein